ncbi:hypothetical protein [Mesoplasma seiffertii]|uniref:hypothetical protein n=1 Tax=Mesoplasma seiffertii TaxID=28224 RepID=UPI00047902D0|nr:hypothetical protein [Mesoplasma seiffertii]
MTKLIILGKLNYQMFEKLRSAITLPYLDVKVRLALPSISRENNKILLNDGLPLELIYCGYESTSIIDNPDIDIYDYSFDNLSTDQIAELINDNDLEDYNKIVVVSTSGVSKNISGGINVKEDLEVPVLFIGQYFENKHIIGENYLINDVAITINNFYETFVPNARGRVIEMEDSYE